jgi:hypothetical protein
MAGHRNTIMFGTGFVAGVPLTPLLHQSRHCYRPYYPDEAVLGFQTRGQR